ncbi:uncharacterized protein At4g15970-like [Zingiber officinale]|uniref:uncharacterized protein At4g15970-like n=1 Tax=Zingiber officinale TaxID=94328 RepID=UPI001C4D7421|nr:uncharacterized protein At4g15970-like [Zingiber officinale]
MHLSRGTRTTGSDRSTPPSILRPRLKYAPMSGPSGVRARLSPRFPMSPLSLRSAADPRRCLSTLLFFAAIAFPCALLYHAADLGFPFPTSSPRPSRDYLAASLDSAFPDQDTDQLEKNDVKLEKVLKEAAMENKTVILTTLNAAWASPGSIIDLFFQSFRTGDGTRRLLDHLVIIALDKKAYIRCISLHTHCFALYTEGVDFSDEKIYMTAGYLSMMWRRIEFLRVILEMGYNFIFSDVDILWFRNPLTQLSPDEDFQIACDHFTGDAFDLENIPNGGFNYVQSNNRSIEFYKFWHGSQGTYPGFHDQDVLNFIKRDPFLIDIGIKIRFLSTAFFGGLCEPSRDFSKVCTMHANCCIGLSRKVHDMRVMLGDWKTYMSLPWKLKRYGSFAWSVPQNCSLAPL